MKRNHLALLVAGVTTALLSCPQVVEAATVTIQSDLFSLGYGFSNDGTGHGSWNTSETAHTNTPTTIGDFTFTPVLSGLQNSTSGPKFISRTPGDMTSADFSAYMTSLVVDASWAGALPPNAAPSPEMKITLHITSMSVWAHNWGGTEVETWFEETTAGNLGESDRMNVPLSWDIMLASGYEQLQWNPGAFTMDGTSMQRAFKVTDTVGGYNDNGYTVLDGFEISGYITVTYEAIPEPSAMALILMGIGGGIVRMRRSAARRKGGNVLVD